jgi:hypothetical protein
LLASRVGMVPRLQLTWARFASGRSPTDFKPRLAESFVEAGKDVAVIPFAKHLVFPALDQNVGLEQVIDASNDHGEPWFGCKTTDGAAWMGSVLTCDP